MSGLSSSCTPYITSCRFLWEYYDLPNCTPCHKYPVGPNSWNYDTWSPSAHDANTDIIDFTLMDIIIYKEY